MKRIFWILASFIILFGLVTRVYAIHGNNLFFTVDEGRDAVYARQIVNYHEIFTKGPQATLKGLYTGPLWYYFVAIGYILFNGNPAGAALMLVFLNLFTTLVLMIVLKKKVDTKLALIVGFGLMASWSFFSTSLYGFNPFALPALAIILILLLVKEKYGWALLPVLLAFNTELAGAIALLFFYIVVGVYLVFQKKLAVRKYLIFAFFLPLIAVSKIIIDFIRTPRNLALNTGTRIGGTNFRQMAIEFAKMMGQTIVPQNTIIGFLIIIAVAILYLKVNKTEFHRKFVILTFCFIFTSYLFFGSNHGWSAWQTAYVPVITFIALLLMCWRLKWLGKILILIILVLNMINFRSSYLDYLKPSPNRSLLYNQEKALDYVYTHNEHNGFLLYTYTDSFYDYTYQYLVSWYGVPKYGFYPCEYSNFPLAHKYLYIPGDTNYVKPELGCDQFRFLIIDSDTNGNQNKNWINDFRIQTVFLERTQIGNITIEKRRVPDPLTGK